MPKDLLAGVDIGGTKTSVVLSSAPPIMLVRRVFPTRPEDGPELAIRNIIASLREALHLQQQGVERLRIIGVSCGGPLDPAAGIIQQPPNLSTWKDVPITSILAQEFGVRCFLENDANAGAMAEHTFGAGRDKTHLIFLTMGTGIGAGLILNGQLFRGASQAAGEIGHIRLTPSGPSGHGKAGSVEGWASGAGMAKLAQIKIAEAVRTNQHTSLSALTIEGTDLTAQHIAIAAEEGDLLAQEIIRATGEKLGQAMAILIDLLNPECILVGGLALRLGESLLAPARKVIEHEALVSSAQICQILPASLGEEIGNVAALCVAIEGEKRDNQ